MEKNKMGMMIIIVILLIMFISFGVGFFLLLKTLKATPPGPGPIQSSGTSIYKLEEIDVIPLTDPIKSNLAVGKDNKNHMVDLKLSIGLNMGGKTDKDIKKEYEKIKPMVEDRNKQTIIRNEILNILRNKTFDELIAPDSNIMLIQEITSCLQELFNTNIIIIVYFDTFNVY